MAWLSGYTYRKEITISRASGAVTLYQMKLLVGESAGATGEDVDCNSHVKTDFSDLRFTAADGTTLLDYWIESITGTTPNQLATVWIEFDSIGTGATTFYMYYGNASISTDPIDAPLTHQWKKYSGNPVLTVGAAGQWDDWWVSIHSIWKEGSTYYAYYNGCKSSTQVQIGLATSTDGITWTKDGGNPILAFGASGKWDDYVVGAPIVWKEGSTWYMLFNGAGASTGAVGIGLATSADGISWTRYDVDNPVMAVGAGGQWDSEMLGPGTTILKEGSTYYLYYTGGTSRSDMTTWKIGLATSTDLHTWTKSGNNPLLSPVGSGNEWSINEPCVQKFGSTYYMWYQMTGDDANLNRSRIGIASSSSKDSGWTKDANNPIHDNAIGAWDSKWTEVPVLIQVGSDWRLYYGGSKGAPATPRSQAGYSTYMIDGGQGTFLLYDNFDGGRTGELWTENGTPTQAGTTLTLDAASEGIKSVATYQYKRFRARINFPAVNDAAYRDWAGFYSAFDQANAEKAVITPVGGATTNIYNANYLTAYDSVSLGAYSGDKIWQIDRFADNIKDYLDATLLRTDATANTIPSASLSAWLMAGITANYKGPFTVDWIFVANLADPEPTWGSWGAETTETVDVTVNAGLQSGSKSIFSVSENTDQVLGQNLVSKGGSLFSPSFVLDQILSVNLLENIVLSSLGSTFNRGDFTAINAFFWSSLDLSPYAGTDLGSTPYRIEVLDGAGKKVIGYLGAVGAGEAGMVLTTDGDFAVDPGPWTKGDGWTIAGGVGVGTAAAGYLMQPAYYTQKSLLKFKFDLVTYVSGALDFGVDGSGLDEVLSPNTYTYYRNAVGGGSWAYFTGVAYPFTGTIDNFSVVQLTECPATGVHIVSSLNGTVRNWASIESGFDPNTIASWNIKLVGATLFSPSFILDQILTQGLQAASQTILAPSLNTDQILSQNLLASITSVLSVLLLTDQILSVNVIPGVGSPYDVTVEITAGAVSVTVDLGLLLGIYSVLSTSIQTDQILGQGIISKSGSILGTSEQTDQILQQNMLSVLATLYQILVQVPQIVVPPENFKYLNLKLDPPPALPEGDFAYEHSSLKAPDQGPEGSYAYQRVRLKKVTEES